MRKFNQVQPGHFKALTRWVMGGSAIIVFFKADLSFVPVIGILLMLTGWFILDQTMHLRQKEHAGFTPTRIEWLFKNYSKSSFFVGGAIYLIGLLITV